MRWIELTKYNSDQSIFVNMQLASSMERSKNDKNTAIWFSTGHSEGQVYVQEEPSRILEMLVEVYDEPEKK